MKHGFIKVAVATPKILVADPTYNAGELIRLAQNAAEEGVRVLVFPELTLTGYTAGDLFLSDTLLTAAKQALAVYLQATAQLEMLSVVGLPLEWNGKLYNCAVRARFWVWFPKPISRLMGNTARGGISMHL